VAQERWDAGGTCRGVCFEHLGRSGWDPTRPHARFSTVQNTGGGSWEDCELVNKFAGFENHGKAQTSAHLPLSRNSIGKVNIPTTYFMPQNLVILFHVLILFVYFSAAEFRCSPGFCMMATPVSVL
jgi:hypothetical protein